MISHTVTRRDGRGQDHEDVFVTISRTAPIGGPEAAGYVRLTAGENGRRPRRALLARVRPVVAAGARDPARTRREQPPPASTPPVRERIGVRAGSRSARASQAGDDQKYILEIGTLPDVEKPRAASSPR